MSRVYTSMTALYTQHTNVTLHHISASATTQHVSKTLHICKVLRNLLQNRSFSATSSGALEPAPGLAPEPAPQLALDPTPKPAPAPPPICSIVFTKAEDPQASLLVNICVRVRASEWYSFQHFCRIALICIWTNAGLKPSEKQLWKEYSFKQQTLDSTKMCTSWC